MEKQNIKQYGNSFWIGLIVLIIGTLILFDKLNFDIVPNWIFNIGTLLIGIGLLVGIRKNFQGIGWLVMLIIGTYFFIEEIPGVDFDADQYIIPVALISIGALILFRSVLARSQNGVFGLERITSSSSSQTDDEFINISSIFGGTKRRIFSKNFGGGQITSIFGGSEIDLTQADVNGVVRIDIVSIFGGTKLLVPANWEVKSDISAILGGVEDKRKDAIAVSPEKKLVLTGVCMFGGLDIKSY